MATSSVAYNKPVLPRVSDTSDLASNRASVYSGKGLDFDGVNDYVLINNFGFNPIASDFTFSTFVRVDTLKDGKIAYAEKGSNDSQLAVWQIRTDGNGDLYFQANTDTWYTINWSGFSSEILGRTVHLTFVRSGAQVLLYLNGKLYGEGFGSIPTTLASANGRFCLGNRLGVSNYLDGLLGQYKIFDVALTAAQVAELYNNPEQILPTGVSAVNLKLWLPMMEGAGSYVYNGAAGSLGEELVSNGTVDEVCQKWGFTDNGYVSATGGKLVWNAPNGSGANAVQYLNIVAGRTYRVTFDYSVNRDGFSIVLGNANAQPTQTGTGTYTVDLTPTSTNSGYFSLNMSGGTGNIAGYMDNISVKEVVPQATGTISGATWVAGLPEPLPQTALMDWNKYDYLDASGTSNYYSGALSLASNSGTIILRHVPYPGSSGNYYYSLGSNTTGGHRALGRQSNNYWFVGYGTSAQDFTTQATINNGYLTDIVSSWDASDNVSIYKNGSFVQTAAKTLADLSGTRTLHLYRSNWTNGDPQSIVFWAYYDRQLSSEEINDIYNGVVEPTAVSDLKYYFTPQNGYSYNGVTLTKTGSFSSILQPKGLTTGKDIFGNSIAVPRSSGAFNFDGASWAEVQDNASTDMTTAVSVEAWVYNTGKSNGKGIVGKWNYPNYGSYLLYNNSTNSMNFFINDAVGTSGSTSIPTGWSHFVGTYDKTTIKLYKNGVLVSSSSYTSNLIDSGSSPVEIGKYSQNITTLYQEQIANPRIYNYALTAEQVADNYNQKATTVGATKTDSELQAYINRTVSAGATVEDHANLLNTLTELDNKSGCL